MFEEWSQLGLDITNKQEHVFSLYKSQDKSVEWNDYQLKEPLFIQYFDKDIRSIREPNIWDDQFRLQSCRQHSEDQKTSSSKVQQKNETKNIPKNYGKATIQHILNNKKKVRKLLTQLKVNERQFYEFLNNSRSHINTIKDIRNFWTNSKFGKIIRILSFEFMRKHSLKYVFNSRLKNRSAYVKYRNKLIDGLKSPELFTNMKDF